MCYVTRSLNFTSSATPADLLVASMAAKPSLPHTCKALVGLETRSYHAAAHSVRSGRPDTLLTELSWLSFSGWTFVWGSLIEFDLIGCQCSISECHLSLFSRSSTSGFFSSQTLCFLQTDLIEVNTCLHSYIHLFQINIIYWFQTCITFPSTPGTNYRAKTSSNISEFMHSNWITLSY